jgi:hypothetical protein
MLGTLQTVERGINKLPTARKTPKWRFSVVTRRRDRVLHFTVFAEDYYMGTPGLSVVPVQEEAMRHPLL